MNERKQITIACNGSTKRSIKRTQNLYLPDTFSFEKFFKESKTIKEYDWAGTVIKKVVILIFPVFYLRLEKYTKFPAMIIFGS